MWCPECEVWDASALMKGEITTKVALHWDGGFEFDGALIHDDQVDPLSYHCLSCHTELTRAGDPDKIPPGEGVAL